MSYKKFRRWVNDRVADGNWGLEMAMNCIDIITTMQKLPWYKRRRYWKAKRRVIAEHIVEPIDRMIMERKEKNNEY